MFPTFLLLAVWEGPFLFWHSSELVNNVRSMKEWVYHLVQATWNRGKGDFVTESRAKLWCLYWSLWEMHGVVYLLSEVCPLIFWRHFFTLVSFSVSPIDMNTADTTAWHQSKIKWHNEPFPSFLGFLVCCRMTCPVCKGPQSHPHPNTFGLNWNTGCESGLIAGHGGHSRWCSCGWMGANLCS